MREFQMRHVLIAASAIVLAGACGDSTGDPLLPAVNENSLAFTRADQSKITFANGSQLSVWCGPWEDGFIATPAVHVMFSGPAVTDKGWGLRVVVADAKIGTPLTFPNNFIFDQPRNAEWFIYDPPNELSTADPPSGGSITFQQLNCTLGGRVTFTAAATIASEFGGGPSVSVSGKVSAPVGVAPPE